MNRWQGWVAFTVWDTGIGIPEDKQHLIFQKFQQLENPLTRRFEGTGLGLVLTQRLARLHGGDVTFISKEGKGSEFTLLLPPGDTTCFTDTGDQDIVSSLAGEQVTEPSPESTTSGSRLALLVEAAPHFVESLHQQLTELGYWVVIARSGTEALEKARRLQPCVIFLNPLLPQLSGWDVLTLIKSHLSTRRIPIIVTATRAEKAQAMQNQADGFLNLPVDKADLQKCLSSLFNLPQAIPRQQPVVKSLILLHLVGTNPLISSLGTSPASTEFFRDLDSLMYIQPCRILEADDLEQAELLARVWKPQVVLLDGTGSHEPLQYLQYLSQQPLLSTLPLVTLTPEMTLAAQQIPGLLVFPHGSEVPMADVGESSLLSTLQRAATSPSICR
ncbi:ATP-binding protein [Neosynechococcus sphagnicola]|uniref:ATP-binding response regulator n=1 Tax=Neosynechococcus sphagnicola TaxID=1501145 RepID=UPI001EF9E813|nr:ATP-binding protein [Neosynechococcus sphagnicola]